MRFVSPRATLAAALTVGTLAGMAPAAAALDWTSTLTRTVAAAGTGCGSTATKTVTAPDGAFDLAATTTIGTPAYDDESGEVVARVTATSAVADTGGGTPGVAFTLTG